jgi:predicted nuclease with TOPRIM domain
MEEFERWFRYPFTNLPQPDPSDTYHKHKNEQLKQFRQEIQHLKEQIELLSSEVARLKKEISLIQRGKTQTSSLSVANIRHMNHSFSVPSPDNRSNFNMSRRRKG